MQWYWILLIVIGGIFLYAVGVGITLGIWARIDKYVVNDDSTGICCMFFWWIILPILGIGSLVRWLVYKISGQRI